MPIEFDCIACGRRVKAPDNLAGKKARCPQCQAVIDVPDQVIEAEEVPTALTATSPPNFAFDKPENDAEIGNESRRPCPMCSEMIVTSAVKCRFCGEVFDATLRQQEEKSWIDRQFIETSMLILVVTPFCCGLFAFIFALVGMLTCQHPTARRNAMIMLAISSVWIAFAFLIGLSGGLREANQPGGIR